MFLNFSSVKLLTAFDGKVFRSFIADGKKKKTVDDFSVWNMGVGIGIAGFLI